MLYIIPTPVGNLEDITLRAIRLLSDSQIILCEDGRVTSKLLTLLKIDNKPRYVNITQNQKFRYNTIKSILEENNNQDLLLVSDAGTPGISDPAFQIIKLAQEIGIKYTVLPGATAMVPAIVASGLAPKEFIFQGFLPIKKGRIKKWEEIKVALYPTVIYESVHRIEKTLNEIKEIFDPTTPISISKEISKSNEMVWTGVVSELVSYIEDTKLKGEFVIVLSPLK